MNYAPVLIDTSAGVLTLNGVLCPRFYSSDDQGYAWALQSVKRRRRCIQRNWSPWCRRCRRYAHGHQENADGPGSLGPGPGRGWNVVSADGAHDLSRLALISQVGVGPGAMCTTRMTAVGDHNFLLYDCAQAAASWEVCLGRWRYQHHGCGLSAGCRGIPGDDRIVVW